MYGYPPYGYYPPPPNSPPPVNTVKEAKQWIKFLKAWEEEKGKHGDKKKDPLHHVPKSTRIELVMMLTMLTPIIGSVYFWVMVYLLRQTLEMIQTLPK